MNDVASDNQRYAAPWKRLAAFVIDLPVLFALAAATRALAGDHAGFESVLAWWLYFAAMESSRLRGTLGKLLLGMAVVDLQGSRLGLVKTSVRYWAKLISVISLGAGFALVFFTDKHQAFHDYAAGNVVIDTRCREQAAG